jgi:hypothetical protein
MKSLADVDITSPGFIQDPYDDYEVLRQEAPVYRDGKTGLYVVTAYEPLKEALNNPAVFSSVPDGSVWGIYSTHPDVEALYVREKGFRPLNTLVTSDPPNHLRYRRLVEVALGAFSVRRMHDSIAATIARLIDAFAARGQCDFQQEFALRLPVAAIADLRSFLRMGRDSTCIGCDRDHGGCAHDHHEQLSMPQSADRHTGAQTHIDAVRRQLSLLSHRACAGYETPAAFGSRLHSVLEALFVGSNDTAPAGRQFRLLLCASLVADGAAAMVSASRVRRGIAPRKPCAGSLSLRQGRYRARRRQDSGGQRAQRAIRRSEPG